MEQGFTIGAIARMTGIPTQTLRSWERRYGVTEPRRSKGGRRIYSGEELDKLRAIKQLLRRGEAIGQLANLELDDLKNRLKVHGLPADGEERPVQDLALNVCGTALAGAMRKVTLPEPMVLGECKTVLRECRDLRGTLLVETDTLQPAQLEELKRFRKDAVAARIVLVVGFVSRQTADLAREAGFDLLPQRLMLATPSLALETLLLGDRLPNIRPRRFTDSQFGDVLSSDPRLACECPQHVVGILKQLNAFEAYSQGCLVDNSDDAATHALLYRVTARARATFEDVLEYLLEVDGIDVGRS